MEVLFPGSADAARRFRVEVIELVPGGRTAVGGVGVASYEVSHPSGAPALALRLTVGGQVIAYTGDTAWTDVLPAVADGADLLIAEAYYFSKAIPHHLSFADLAAHRSELACRRVLLTHMSADMLARGDQPGFGTAWDGCVIHLPD
jgi:ribonuclease BN (tRNA processing enzyme)